MRPSRKLAVFLAGLLAALGAGYGVGTFFDLAPQPAPVVHEGGHR